MKAEWRDREAVFHFYGGDKIPLPHRTKARLWLETGGADEPFHEEWNRLAEAFAVAREASPLPPFLPSSLPPSSPRAEGEGAPAAQGARGACGAGAPPAPWLILAARYTKDHLLFWRPKACGYTIDLNQAGRFTEAEAKSKVAGERGAHVALPESALEGLHIARVIDGDHCTKLARLHKEKA